MHLLCVTNGGLQRQVGYTTTVIKMLIKHQNIKVCQHLTLKS